MITEPPLAPQGPGSPAREGSAIGAALSAIPMRTVMLIGGPSIVALGALRCSAFRGDGPARKGCLWHRRESYRLAPLELKFNHQNKPLECHYRRPSRNC